MDKQKKKADEANLMSPPRSRRGEQDAAASHLSSEECETLESLIMKRKWSKASIFLINANTIKEVKKRRHQRAANGRRSGRIFGTSGSTVKNILSLALVLKAPVGIIETILQIEPQLSLLANSHGLLPLHIACACGLEYGIVRVLLKHDHGKTAYKVDKYRRTPIHLLAHYVCHPQDVEKGLVFGEYVFNDLTPTLELDGDLSRTSTSGSGSSKSFWNKRKSTKESASTKGQDAEEQSTMSITQDQFSDQLKNFQQLAYVGPLALFCRDVTERTPTDILHDCKANFEPDDQPPRWERADISCVVIREELTRYHMREKKKEEGLGQERFGIIQKKTDCPTLEGSSVSESISVGLSNLEVESISLGQMDLSVTSWRGGDL